MSASGSDTDRPFYIYSARTSHLKSARPESPMCPEPKLGIPKPFRTLNRLQGLPGWLEDSVGNLIFWILRVHWTMSMVVHRPNALPIP